jgi:hypothetical protein
MDFMTAENSMLVPYRMVPVRSAPGSPYHAQADQEWADPDLDAAVAALVALAAGPGLRESLGAVARTDIAAIARSPVRSHAIEEIARLAAASSASAADHVARTAALRRAPYRAWGVRGRAGYAVRSAQRALGLREPVAPPRLIV